MYHALIGHIPRSRIVYFRLCTLIILSAYPAYLIAQREQNSQEINELRKMARSSESRAEVYEAIDYYTRYFDSGGYDDRSAYQLAGLYYLTRDYSGAKKYYDTVLVNRPKKFPKAFFYGGIVCMSLQEYDQAIENFDTFRKVFRGRRDPDNLRRLARDLGSNAEWAMVRIDSVANIQIGHLGNSVNQPHIEFSPFPVDEHTLIYGSQRNDTSAGIPALRRLYTAEKKEDFWYSTGMLEGDLNSDEYHSGNAAISPDGKRMYFTRCRQNWRDETICEIFLAVKDGGTWQVLEKLPYPINDENHTTTQPAVGVNYRTGTDILYFVSDRDGGRGGLDIWYSVFDIRAGEFKEPRNAGSAINTRGDECCPFFDAKNNTLYFSSKGHPGFGGFDIFRAAGSLRRWTAAEALPQPINSSYDDTYFSTLSTGQDGFFTSNRPGAYFMENGSCCDDIFYFRYNTCIKAQVSGTVLNITNYDVYDELNEKYHLGLEYPESNVPAEGVGVQVYLSREGKQDEFLISTTETGADGKFFFNLDMNRTYRLVVKNYGFFDKVISFSTNDIDCDKVLDVGISTINVLPEITIRFNVYYEFDKSRLTAQARSTIDSLLMPVFDLFPEAIIEIGSHTDHNGNDEYNIKLSQRRSESVVNYLISRGISSDRLVPKGYGESQPIAPNTHADGSDNPQGRQLNRRTELRVIGEMTTFYIEDE